MTPILIAILIVLLLFLISIGIGRFLRRISRTLEFPYDDDTDH